MQRFFIFLVAFFHLCADVPETFLVEMRDGYKLPTDVYFPKEHTSPLPCILVRAPSGRRAHAALKYLFLVEDGFIVAIQDTRSILDKEHRTYPYVTDGWGKLQDGYDAVEWLAHAPFCNGKVGTIGGSALGITQVMMAPSAPPSLCCQYIITAPTSLYHHAIFLGGQFLKSQVEGWLWLYANDTSVLNSIAAQPFYNIFWDSFNALTVAHQVVTPAMHVGGWYDTFLEGTIEGFLVRQKEGGVGAKGTQKLVIGPWTHFFPHNPMVGDFPVPKEGLSPPEDISPRRWFDFYLRGIPNRVDLLPPVIYYVMGPFDGSPSKGNVWRTADTFPPPGGMPLIFFLTKEGGLQRDKPRKQDFLEYVYNPLYPTPTLGGRNLFLESGAKDQRPIESRSDILVFTTPPLEEDTEITGFLHAEIFFGSSERNTDISLRLTDVYPDGRSILITEGHMHVNIPLSQPTALDLDLGPTSIVFAKGHSIRLNIASANYPKYEKNTNVGYLGVYKQPPRIAKNSVFIGGHTASRIILPFMPSP